MRNYRHIYKIIHVTVDVPTMSYKYNLLFWKTIMGFINIGPMVNLFSNETKTHQWPSVPDYGQAHKTYSGVKLVLVT
jgi:hypothetical protein